MPFRIDRLREARKQKGLTQRELSKLCNMNEAQVSRYENGKIEPSVSYLELMARHLEVSTDYLIGLSDYPHGQFGEPLQADQSELLQAYEAGDSARIMELVSAKLRLLAKEDQK